MKKGKLIFKILKVLIIIISIGYIILKLNSERQRGVLSLHLLDFDFIDSLYFLVVVFLVVVNWFLESIKFKYLIKPFQNLSINKSIQAILAGITVSIFTPKRIGEFGGRIFVLETKNRLNGVFATLLGNLSQLLITLIIGMALFPFYWSKSAAIRMFITNNSIFNLIVASLILIILLAYLNLSKIGVVLSNFKYFKKYDNFTLFLKRYNKYELVNFLSISLFRYFVFTFQFFVLLNLFNVEISYANAIVGISQIYFFMTIIPTFSLGELGVRGSISVFVMSVFSPLSTGVIAASIILWILNLAIPALIGTYFLAKLKY